MGLRLRLLDFPVPPELPTQALELVPAPKLTSEERALTAVRWSAPLDRAMLCGNCERVFEAIGSLGCPSCGSHQAVNLGRALGERAVTP